MGSDLKREKKRFTEKALEIFKGNAIFVVFIVIFIVYFTNINKKIKLFLYSKYEHFHLTK